MTNGNTIKERLAIIETKVTNLNLWLKGILLAVLASLGINVTV